MKRLLLFAAVLAFSTIASADNFTTIGPNGQFGFGSVNYSGYGTNGWYQQNGRTTQFWVQPTYRYGYGLPNYGYYGNVQFYGQPNPYAPQRSSYRWGW